MTFKDRAITVALSLLAKLPLSVAQRIGELGGSIACACNSRARKVTEENLLICLSDYSAEQRSRLVRYSLRESGKTVAEMGAVWLWPGDRALGLIRQVHGRELIEQGLAGGKGVIVLSPHLGNWEMLGLYLGHEFGITALYQPPENGVLDKLILQARRRTGANMVPTNRRGVLALLKTLKSGGLAGILPDQVPAPESGIFAPYFGEPALTMTLVSSLVKKTGASVLCGYAKRLRGGGFDLKIERADERVYADDMQVSVAGLNHSVEKCVLQDPEQYQWQYKRFKKRPPGAKRLYHSP